MWPNHFNNLTYLLGCKPCECDIGGAYDNKCDVDTGQCRCRPKIKGRKCDEVEDGYFTGALDYLLFEGETANGTTGLVRIIRYTLLFYHVEPLKNGASPILPSSLFRDS